MPNELREKIANILKNCTMFTSEPYDYADQILSLLAPELEKARKWDKVVELAKYEWESSCDGCPANNLEWCESACKRAYKVCKVVDALAGEETP